MRTRTLFERPLRATAFEENLIGSQLVHSMTQTLRFLTSSLSAELHRPKETEGSRISLKKKAHWGIGLFARFFTRFVLYLLTSQFLVLSIKKKSSNFYFLDRGHQTQNFAKWKGTFYFKLKFYLREGTIANV